MVVSMAAASRNSGATWSPRATPSLVQPMVPPAQRRRTNNRIKLSRELMLRLSKALGCRGAKQAASSNMTAEAGSEPLVVATLEQAQAPVQTIVQLRDPIRTQSAESQTRAKSDSSSEANTRREFTLADNQQTLLAPFSRSNGGNIDELSISGSSQRTSLGKSHPSYVNSGIGNCSVRSIIVDGSRRDNGICLYQPKRQRSSSQVSSSESFPKSTNTCSRVSVAAADANEAANCSQIKCFLSTTSAFLTRHLNSSNNNAYKSRHFHSGAHHRRNSFEFKCKLPLPEMRRIPKTKPSVLIVKRRKLRTTRYSWFVISYARKPRKLHETKEQKKQKQQQQQVSAASLRRIIERAKRPRDCSKVATYWLRHNPLLPFIAFTKLSQLDLGKQNEFKFEWLMADILQTRIQNHNKSGNNRIYWESQMSLVESNKKERQQNIEFKLEIITRYHHESSIEQRQRLPLDHRQRRRIDTISRGSQSDDSSILSNIRVLLNNKELINFNKSPVILKPLSLNLILLAQVANVVSTAAIATIEAKPEGTLSATSSSQSKWAHVLCLAHNQIDEFELINHHSAKEELLNELKNRAKKTSTCTCETSKCDIIVEKKEKRKENNDRLIKFSQTIKTPKLLPQPQQRIVRSKVTEKRKHQWFNYHNLLWLILVMLQLNLFDWPQVRRVSGLQVAHSGNQVELSRASTSDELNRAVLATMSTQSPISREQESNGTSITTHHYSTRSSYLQSDELSDGPELVAGQGNGGGIDSTDVSDFSLNQLHQIEFQQQQTMANPLQSNGNEMPATFLDKLLQFCRIFVMGAIIIGDICGNSLVILSVFRHSKLRVTTNWFVVSLACADILVALFAMTFNASVIISGRWLFKPWVCDFWNSCDVLASTASILHLCCISIDRYIAIMRPLDYPMKITTRRVVYALCAVWISSALLSYIPIFTGVYTTAEHIKWLNDNPDQCEFVVNRVYAIVSSSISFWIPCCIMVFTYYRIYREATRQEKFIYKAQSIMPAPMSNHHSHSSNHHSGGNHCGANKSANRSKQRRSKSMALPSNASSSTQEARIRHLAIQQQQIYTKKTDNSSTIATTNLNSTTSIPAITSARQLTSATGLAQVPSSISECADDNNNNNSNSNNNRVSSMMQLDRSSGGGGDGITNQTLTAQSGIGLDPNNNTIGLEEYDKSFEPVSSLTKGAVAFSEQERHDDEDDDDDQDSNSGQSTPTKRSISKMKREHKAAKTLGIIMGVFILCWLPFFSWYTPQHICGHACDGIVPRGAVTILFWIGYFNSTLNPIIYAYFNSEFRDAFKKTLQWIFCCCSDLKCLRVNRPNDNQHYNCTYRSTQEIGLVNS